MARNEYVYIDMVLGFFDATKSQQKVKVSQIMMNQIFQATQSPDVQDPMI